MIDETPERRVTQRAADLLKVGRLVVCSERDGVLHTISVQGELDLATADVLERELVRVEGYRCAVDRLGPVGPDVHRFHGRAAADRRSRALACGLKSPHAAARAQHPCNAFSS